MLELNNALSLIMKGIEKPLTEYGFKPEYPNGVFPPELPVEQDGNKSVIMYRGEKGRIRIELNGDKLALFCATADEDDAPDDDMKRVSYNLLDLAEFNEKDIQFICDDYNETFEKKFSTKNPYAGKKTPTPVSKSQAKSGALAYDGNTLANRISTIYPELRAPYKENFETYGEFLAEDFFVNHGNKYVVDTIRRNDKTQMKKLFKLLNDIYENGTNDTQSLVAVTVLGVSLSENPELFDNAKEYFSDIMLEPVTEIVKYLSKSKSARMRLENPPIYKPKKEKKKGLMSQMMGLQ